MEAFTCPRCLYSAERDIDSRFCPRCGLNEEPAAGSNELHRGVKLGSVIVAVAKRLAFGDICNLYRAASPQVSGTLVFKITRSHYSNQHLARELDILRQLHDADDGRFEPFLPEPLGRSNIVQSAGEPPRLATVLKYHGEIDGPDDLYSLQEVRAAYPNGIDPRDMAWMWRRILTVLGFVHTRGLAHGLVTPDHILIEPRGHKLVLISWCGAVGLGSSPGVAAPVRWREWIDPAQRLSSASDLACASRSMLYLKNSSVDPAIVRHFERAGATSDAWKLLGRFRSFDRSVVGSKAILWNSRCLGRRPA